MSRSTVRRRGGRVASFGGVAAVHLGLLYLASLAFVPDVRLPSVTPGRGAAAVKVFGIEALAAAASTPGSATNVVADDPASERMSPAVDTAQMGERAEATSPSQTRPLSPPPDPAAPGGGGLSSPMAGVEGSAGSAAGGAALDPWAHASLLDDGPAPDPAAQLLAQAARCWRGAEDSAPVILSVVLDDRGRVVGAPTPRRPPEREQSAAERRAVAEAKLAVETCAPYTMAAVAGQQEAYDLAFGPSLR